MKENELIPWIGDKIQESYKIHKKKKNQEKVKLKERIKATNSQIRQLKGKWSRMKAEMFDYLHFCLHVHLRAKIDHSSETVNTILL